MPAAAAAAVDVVAVVEALDFFCFPSEVEAVAPAAAAAAVADLRPCDEDLVMADTCFITERLFFAGASSFPSDDFRWLSELLVLRTLLVRTVFGVKCEKV